MGTIIRSCSTLSHLGFPCLSRFCFCCSPFCWQYSICSQSLFFHFSFPAIWFPVSAHPFIPKPAPCASCSGEAPWGRESPWRGSVVQQGQEERQRCLVHWFPFHKVTKVLPNTRPNLCVTLGWPRWNWISCNHQFLWNGYKARELTARIQFNSFAPVPREDGRILAVCSQEGVLLWDSGCHLTRNLHMY